MRRKLNGSHAKHPDGRGPVCGHLEPGDRQVSGLRVDCPACLAIQTSASLLPTQVLGIVDRWTNGRGVRRTTWKLSNKPTQAWVSLFQEVFGDPLIIGEFYKAMSDTISVEITQAEEASTQERLQKCAVHVNELLTARTQEFAAGVANMDEELAEC